MTKKIGKQKKLVKQIAREKKSVESEQSTTPKTIIFCKPNADIVVRQLVADFKSTMEPNTIKEIFCQRRSTLKEFIDFGTKCHVKNIIYFTHNRSRRKICDWNESINYKLGAVYCHMIVIPHGPSFTYRVKEFGLKRDIQTLTGFGMSASWLQQSPLLIAAGFQSQDSQPHLKAVSSSFQNMIPTLNINKTQYGSVKRVLLLSHQSEMPHVDRDAQLDLGEVFVFRHFFIRLENKELNRNVRKLGVGRSSKNVKLPDLSQFASMSDFIEGPGGAGSESEMSDFEGAESTFDLPQPVKELPGSTGKTAVRLLEVGPRMTLQLLKIQEGVHSGVVLYHRCVTRTKEELLEIERKRAEKIKLKAKRREQQEKNVEKKKLLKEEHKKACLKGMKGDEKEIKTENLEVEDDEEEVEEISEEEVEVDENEDDDDGGNDEEDEEEDDDEGMEDVNDSLDEDVEEDEEDDGEGMEDVNDSLDEDSDDIEQKNQSEEDLDLQEDESEEISERKPIPPRNTTDNRSKKRSPCGVSGDNCKKRKF